MPTRIPLPIQLSRRPFTVETGRNAGLSTRRLFGSDLERPFHGVRTPLPSATIADLCLALNTRLPDHAFFSGATAAVLMNVPLPHRLEASRLLHVSVPAPARAIRGKGVVGHSVQCHSSEIRPWFGVRISTPERVWCELAAVLDLPDLVAAGDRLIHRNSRFTSTERLGEYLESYPGRVGLALLREALTLLSERSESRPESLLRVILLRAGLEGLVVNLEITTSGGFRYRADLAFPERKVLVEYQSDYHGESRQFRRDMTRIDRLRADGWHVMQINNDDLMDAAELVARVRHVLETHGRA